MEVGGSGRSSPEQLFRVRPPRAWAPDVPPPAAEHAVLPIERPRLVDENGPHDAGIVCVRASPRPALERDHDDADIEFLKRRFVMLQLQHMPTARQSSQVPMEDQQQPVPVVVIEVVETTLRIRQCKWHRRITNAYAHWDSSITWFTARSTSPVGCITAPGASVSGRRWRCQVNEQVTESGQEERRRGTFRAVGTA